MTDLESETTARHVSLCLRTVGNNGLKALIAQVYARMKVVC